MLFNLLPVWVLSRVSDMYTIPEVFHLLKSVCLNDKCYLVGPIRRYA